MCEYSENDCHFFFFTKQQTTKSKKKRTKRKQKQTKNKNTKQKSKKIEGLHLIWIIFALRIYFLWYDTNYELALGSKKFVMCLLVFMCGLLFLGCGCLYFCGSVFIKIFVFKIISLLKYIHISCWHKQWQIFRFFFLWKIRQLRIIENFHKKYNHQKNKKKTKKKHKYTKKNAQARKQTKTHKKKQINNGVN